MIFYKNAKNEIFGYNEADVTHDAEIQNQIKTILDGDSDADSTTQIKELESQLRISNNLTRITIDEKDTLLAPTKDQKKATEAVKIRSQRDTIVERVSREINRLEDTGKDSSAWRTYREQLRNVPEQDGFPFDVTWPEQPGDHTGK